MKISVITVTFNSAATILDTLKSVNSQDYVDIEHILIDGASTDATLEIAKKYGDRITAVVSEKDQGIYHALNKGIALATGDVVGFLHSDDIFSDEGVLSQVAEKFIEENADAVYGNLNYVSKSDTGVIIRRWVSGKFTRSKFKNGWMPPHPTLYMKRKHYLSYGCFDVKFAISADYESMLRFFWRHKLSASYIPRVLVKMRIGGESNRNIRNVYIKMKEDGEAMKKNGIPPFRALLFKNLSKVKQFL